MATRRQYKCKRKWTDQMNEDLLSCKLDAVAMTQTVQSSLDKNGKKKGYIKLMKELWDAKGYSDFGFSSQNLRDQAARLEKLSKQESSENPKRVSQIPTNSMNLLEPNKDDENLMLQDSQTGANLNGFNTSSEMVYELQSVNQQITSQDLPKNQFGIPEAPMKNQSNACISGCLPEYNCINKPTMINWGKRGDGQTIDILTSDITNAYDEITTWKKNVFLVPYGKIGRDFIDQITMHINDWNSCSENQHVCLKAAFVLLAVGLQKPSPKSKAKDHQEVLSNRLTLWKDGEINKLVREGKIIQSRIGKFKGSNQPNKAKVFAKLVLEGQINSAVRFLSETSNGGVLKLTDDVMMQLKQKHPEPQPAKLGSVLFGPLNEEIPESIYLEINGEMVRQAALRTKGSGGPSGVDANGFRRMLACKSFKQSSTRLCEAIATMTRILCTQYIDPSSIEALIASRLIPLDKGEGAVRPIGVGEVIRRISAKCVMKFARKDVLEASGSLQLCAGQKSGSEAAIHAMNSLFEADEVDAVLLIDASNAFNSLNRAAALHNIQLSCPIIAAYVINTYRQAARLFIVGGKEIASAEGTTQGDPLAMAFYAISTLPLITSLQALSSVKQCWFADDASGAGRVKEIKHWWDALNTLGPDLGYFPKDEKCWVIVKPGQEESAREAFRGTAVNVTVQGKKHLGAALGSREYLEEYVNEKVSSWVNEVTKLAEFALSQPQASYAAYTFGLKHRWTYFLRTLPDIQDLLEPLEKAVSQILIPAITEHKCNQLDRDILALPARLGGMGFENPSHEAGREYTSSKRVTAPLVDQIVAQSHQLPDELQIKSMQQVVRKERVKECVDRAERIKRAAPPKTRRMLDVALEKGSSLWLKALPLKELGFNLNKREFRDAVKLRYDWPIDDIPTTCICGDNFTVDHAMICKRGGFIILRHNELRDLEAELLNIVCSDVQVEPVLQEISGEQLHGGSNRATDARLDIRARGFWESQRSAFFDVRICHPNADSYRNLELRQVYQIHENEKKRLYARRVLEIEQGSFTPLVFTTTGGMGQECMRYHSRLAELVARKKGEDYATTITWIRARISFALLRSALTCLRGSRGRKIMYDIKNTDINVENTESAIYF